MKKSFETRFWEKVDMSGVADCCWSWTGATTNAGYGKIWYNGNLELAHRAIWMCWIGPIPDGAFILHSCDNPRCVRITHLRLGTHQENMDDCQAKGRNQKGLRNGRYTRPESILRGEENGASKLTQEQVDEMRRRYREESIPQKVLGAEYGISQQQVSRIMRGERWGKPRMKHS